jgi:8-oxo-dGTP diphosphatase
VSSGKAPGEETVQVRAAGGIVARRVRRRLRRRPELVLVHRPQYDDWTFPKGKRDGDETDEQTALREVEEETGLRCALGREIGETRYHDGKGRLKLVRYWLMEPREGSFTPNKEVDELRWLPPDDACRLLTYDHDRALLQGLRFGLRIRGKE